MFTVNIMIIWESLAILWFLQKVIAYFEKWVTRPAHNDRVRDSKFGAPQGFHHKRLLFRHDTRKSALEMRYNGLHELRVKIQVYASEFINYYVTTTKIK